MAGHGRHIAPAEQIPEAALVQVAHVHRHAQALHFVHHLHAIVCQTVVRVDFSGRADAVGVIPDQRAHADAAFMPAGDGAKILLEHLAALQREHEGAFALPGVRRIGHLDEPRGRQLACGGVFRLGDGLEVASGPLGTAPEGEGLQRHAAGMQPLRGDAAFRQRALHHAQGEERIGMGIGDEHGYPTFPGKTVDNSMRQAWQIFVKSCP